MQLLRKILKDLILVSVVMIIFGLLLLIWPDLSLITAVKVIGVGLIISGALTVIDWIRNRADSSYFSLAGAVLSIIAGLYLFLKPEGIISFFPTLIGLAVLINGIMNLLKALDLRKAGYGNWKLPCLMAILTIALGVLVFSNPFETMTTLVMLGGAVLVYNGLSNIFIATRH